MLKALSLPLVIASLLGLSACATTGGQVQTRVVADPSVNFSKFRTYSFAPPPSTIANMDVAARATVQGALNTGLAARGMTPSKTPDFIIVYHLTTADKTSARQYNEWQYGWEKVRDYASPGSGKTYAFGGFTGNEISGTQYTQGTLIVDFIDVITQKMFWRGTSVGPVGAQKQTDTQLSAGVSQMLQQVPVLR